jgi:group I intron endonuclease
MFKNLNKNIILSNLEDTQSLSESGIYFIRNKVSGKYYVGSTVKFLRRFNDHFAYLERGNHKNPHLQSAWKKYGHKNFEFGILEKVNDPNSIYEKEKEYLQKFKSGDREFGYNADYVDTDRQWRMSEETKNKLSIFNKDRCSKPEEKERMSKASRGERNGMSRFSEAQVIEIRQLYETGDYTQKKIAEMYKTERSVITGIINFKTWKYLCENIPEKIDRRRKYSIHGKRLK